MQKWLLAGSLRLYIDYKVTNQVTSVQNYRYQPTCRPVKLFKVYRAWEDTETIGLHLFVVRLCLILLMLVSVYNVKAVIRLMDDLSC